jgi:serine/threonine-protein kinase
MVLLLTLVQVPAVLGEDPPYGTFERDELERYRKAMDKIWEGGAGAGGLPIPNLRERYAAIAYSPSTGASGSVQNVGSRLEAVVSARGKCRVADARTVIWVKGGYCALAAGKDPGVFATGTGATAEQARAVALAGCRKRTADCAVVACVCSGGAMGRVPATSGDAATRRVRR